MKMIVILDYTKKIGTLEVHGDTTPEDFVHYLTYCRKQFRADWIQLLNFQDTPMDFSAQEIDKLAQLTKMVGNDYPVQATIVVTDRPLTIGLINMWRQFAELEDLKYPIRIVKDMDEAIELMTKIRSEAELKKEKSKVKGGD